MCLSSPGGGSVSYGFALALETNKWWFLLSEFDLKLSPPFIALSYAWGNPHDKKPAICNDSCISITNSLYTALRQMRGDEQFGYIWADAICINQSDDVEKTEQVRMMVDIYASAYKVIIWLGPEGHGDRTGLYLMKEICDTLKLGTLSKPQLSVDLARFYGVPSERWKAMVSFLRKPWFWRAWILQEYQRARDRIFQCGPMVITAGFFRDIYMTVGRCPELKQLIQLKGLVLQADEQPHLFAPFFEIQKVFDMLRTAELKLPLFALLSKTRGCKSTDPRDRVFALVGISSDTKVDLIDYKAHLSDILVRVSTNHIQGILKSPSSEIFDYLCFVHGSDVEGLPSWVPSFDLPQSFWGMSRIFRTETKLKDNPRILLGDDNILRIAGLLVDQVTTVIDNDQTSQAATAIAQGDFKEGFARSQEIVKCYTNMLDLAMSQQSHDTTDDVIDIFWKSLVFETGDTANRSKCTQEMRQGFESWHESLILHHFLMQIGIQRQNGHLPLPTQARVLETFQDTIPPVQWRPLTLEPDRVVDAAFVEEIRTYIKEGAPAQLAFLAPFQRFGHGRRYFRSKRGYLGWVPRHVWEGDRICAFYGSRYPFVVRPHRDGWRLLGACYMYGLMEGEAIKISEANEALGKMIQLI